MGKPIFDCKKLLLYIYIYALCFMCVFVRFVSVIVFKRVCGVVFSAGGEKLQVV